LNFNSIKWRELFLWPMAMMLLQVYVRFPRSPGQLTASLVFQLLFCFCMKICKKNIQAIHLYYIYESPYHTVGLQKGYFAASNPILTLHQVQNIKMRTKQQIKTIKTQNALDSKKPEPPTPRSSLKPSRRSGSAVTHGGRWLITGDFLHFRPNSTGNTKKCKSNL
jgi:hypothetical protein